MQIWLKPRLHDIDQIRTVTISNWIVLRCVAFKFMIILQDLITAIHSKSGRSKFDRKLPEPGNLNVNEVDLIDIPLRPDADIEILSSVILILIYLQMSVCLASRSFIAH